MNFYFYIIQHIPTKKYYAGSRTSKSCNKKLLECNGYLTSSPIIKELIENDGIESFKIRKIKYFKNKKDALMYEYKFLNKVDAANNPNFFNCHNNNGGFGKNAWSNISKEKRNKTNLTKFGAINPFQNENIKIKSKESILEKYGVDNISKSIFIKNKKQVTNLNNLGVKYPRQSMTIIEKTKQTCISKYGVDNPSKDKSIIEKIKKSKLEKYGDDGFSNREKSIKTNILKYGVDNPSKCEEIKNKIRNKALERTQRLVVKRIQNYKKIFKLNLKTEICPSWFHKDDNFLENALTLLVEKYGVIN